MFRNRDGYYNHVSTVHNEERGFKCEQCQYAAKTAFLLNKHIKYIHEKSRSHVCHICGKGFFEPYKLKKHQEVHEKKANQQKIDRVAVPCDMCERTFETNRALGMHKSHSHVVERTASFTCELCGAAFTTLGSLSRHKRLVHTSKEDIDKIECRCEKCNSQFDTSLELNEHLTTCLHQDVIKNFNCDTCEGCDNYFWHSGLALKRHIAEVHANIRHVCNICGQVLTTPETLQRHKSTFHAIE